MSQRGAANNRRAFHDDEAGALQMRDQPLGDHHGHDLIGVVNALAALKAQSEREGGVEAFLRTEVALLGAGLGGADQRDGEEGDCGR